MRALAHNRHRRHSRAVQFVCIATLLSGGCTALQSSKLSPEALRSSIRSGSLIEPGDEVWLSTRDGNVHAFKVSEVGSETVDGHLMGGEPVSVAVDDVVALSTIEVQVVPTAWASVGASYIGLAVLLYATIASDL